jgi:hypothetical protein
VLTTTVGPNSAGRVQLAARIDVYVNGGGGLTGDDVPLTVTYAALLGSSVERYSNTSGVLLLLLSSLRKL